MPLKSLDLILSLSKDKAWIPAFFSTLLEVVLRCFSEPSAQS